MHVIGGIINRISAITTSFYSVLLETDFLLQLPYLLLESIEKSIAMKLDVIEG
jgi:hypothetical protein